VTDVFVGFGRHVGAYPDEHQHGVSIQSAVNLGNTLLISANSARMKNSNDLILAKVVYIAIIYHIPDSCINILNDYELVSITRLMKTENFSTDHRIS